MLLVGFKPMIQIFEQLKICCALDCMATIIGMLFIQSQYNSVMFLVSPAMVFWSFWPLLPGHVCVYFQWQLDKKANSLVKIQNDRETSCPLIHKVLMLSYIRMRKVYGKSLHCIHPVPDLKLSYIYMRKMWKNPHCIHPVWNFKLSPVKDEDFKWKIQYCIQPIPYLKYLILSTIFIWLHLIILNRKDVKWLELSQDTAIDLCV
jgi:hypothetical protein